MTTDSLTETLRRTAQAVSSSIERVFEDLQAVASELIAASEHMPAVPESTDFSFLQPLFEDLLVRSSPLIEGGGIAYQPGSLRDAEYWLEWWRMQPTGRPKFIGHDLNPGSIRYYDYATRDWFKVPAAAGHPVAVGPYIDMGGIDVNTVTLTVPARTGHGTHVLGCDLSLSALEAIFLRAIRTPEPSVVLVGRNGRIIASNSPRLLIGTRADVDAATDTVPVAPEKYDVLPWNLLVTNQ
ncbi:cache domain-containing protein [Arthrobacter sp. CC3]|uniref:cache domain-containing protein n=1 Tax=Arthrobacter sp. CC3 TaxID=3029185 RepID=UPI0032663B47